MKKLLKFNEEAYRESAKEIRKARKIAEDIADKISKEGFENIFFTAVGGSLSPMMAIDEFAKELTTIPVYVQQAAELLTCGNKKLNKNSIVITLSKSGDTKESVAIANACKENGIRTVCCTGNEDSPLAKACTYMVPMKHKNGVEYEYILLYWLFFRLLHNKKEFDNYEAFADGLSKLPENLLKVKEQFDEKAEKIAAVHYDAPIQYWVGGTEMWGETYLFSMCILEEMQWIKTKAVTSAEFFHGTLELIEKGISVFLIKGEGKGRALDERAQKFLESHTDKLVVIDTAEYALDDMPKEFRWIVAPLVCSTCLVDRLAAHLEAHTGHNLDYRRYYRQFDY
ncbi:SIS domain-containing protein [Amedibacillus sp. YH-ame10]